MGWFLSKEKGTAPAETLLINLLIRRDYPFNADTNEMNLDKNDIDWLVSILMTLHLNDQYHFYGRMVANYTEKQVQAVGKLIIKMNRAYTSGIGYWSRSCINNFATMYIVDYNGEFERTALAASALNTLFSMWERALTLLHSKLEQDKGVISDEFYDSMHRALYPSSDV